MKKKILSVLAVLAAGFIALTSCQEEKPYSFYQVGVNFIGIDATLSQDEINKLSPNEKDKYSVAGYLAGWLINHDFIMTGSTKPIIIEGADEAENDRQAIVIYDNKLSKLQEPDTDKDLDDIIREAQLKTGADGKPELTLTTSGSLTFSYIMLKGSNAQSTIRSTLFTVDYAPLSTPSEPQEPEL